MKNLTIDAVAKRLASLLKDARDADIEIRVACESMCDVSDPDLRWRVTKNHSSITLGPNHEIS